MSSADSSEHNNDGGGEAQGDASLSSSSPGHDHDPDVEEEEEAVEKSYLFMTMARHPLPFLLIIPLVFIALTAAGWSQDDYVETEVSNIWIATTGSYWKDKKYEENLSDDDEGGSSGRGSTTAFAAMAISRDGDNLFTANRLEEIRRRMEKTEATTIDYNGNTYTWPDLCASNNAGINTTYEFPCVRISPMDLFQEARWFFDETSKVTWYNKVVYDAIIRPRIPRFGVMTRSCTSFGNETQPEDDTRCNHAYLLRTSPDYAEENGKGRDFADPFKIFNDIGNFEMNDPCKMCIEENYETTMTALTRGTVGLFGVMAQELQRLALSNTTHSVDAAQMLNTKILPILQQGIDREAVEEFYFFYVTRALYAEFGYQSYMDSYAFFMSNFGRLCDGYESQGLDLNGCPRTVNASEAREALLNHADNDFSAISTSGIPIPYWAPNGGPMFFGTSPVGGSGLDLKGTPLSSGVYFDLQNILNQTAWSPLYGKGGFVNAWDDPLWESYVEGDPVYKWFEASVTPSTSYCSNGYIPGTQSGNATIDTATAFAMQNNTEMWCTKYDTPNEAPGGTETVQYFSKMWYRLLIDSPEFLNLTQGESDPYVWTTGEGCGYELGEGRYAYTGQDAQDILSNGSGYVYYIDEGESVGVLDPHVLIGDATPPVGSYSIDNPLQKVGSIQTVYFTLLPENIIKRVQNCKRPGGPIEGLTIEDGKEILYKFKEKFEDNWSEGWDDADDGGVQFVGFYDDVGAIGTTGRMLEEVTLSSGTLMAVSFVVIVVFSALFLASFDVVQSRVLITVIGVALAILGFFAAMGLAILVGIKMNVSIGWTLPFIVIGIGVDDMYIILLALKRRGGYSENDFVGTMKDVLVPVSMTSIVNASMFAVMNISDIPAVYKTAQVAVISVCFLYAMIIFCFPAYCYLDMKRQKAGRCDILFCIKKSNTSNVGDEKMHTATGTKANTEEEQNAAAGCLFQKVYRPLVLGSGKLRMLSQIVIWLGTFALLGVSIWGITETQVGLGLEDFFPDDYQASIWAKTRTKDLATWGITMNWGALDYTDPNVQLKMIKQFEDVIATPHVSDVETTQLWIADFAVWTTRQCTENFARSDVDQLECGMNLTYPEDGTSCSGTWKRNTLGLREKTFVEEPCQPSKKGICRPTSEMHPLDLYRLGVSNISAYEGVSWCPVFEGWSTDKLKFCVQKWRNYTGGGGGLLLVEDTATENPECKADFYNDDEIISPIPISKGPTMFGIGLVSHEATVDMIDDTRAICDDDEDMHCWMSGIPYDYWEQYTYVEELLYELCGIAVAVGFGVASVFLTVKLFSEHRHSRGKIIAGSVSGGLLISATTVLSVVTVIGLSSLADVSLTAFSDMSYVLSVGFAVEYSVHIVHRFITAPMNLTSARERVAYTMKMLFLPTFLSFLSSTIGVVCLAFTEFEFNNRFFFRPLIIVMFATYFYGCWFLPVLLSILDFNFLKLGHTVEEGAADVMEEKEDAELGPADVMEKKDSADTGTDVVVEKEADEAVPVTSAQL